ncbi:DNA primase [Desulfobulbus alkaliphilus]|uniref:DNA primase n=1 Tax=Desulfobulbus alkaliphilus TaxID=869814 RepID=UPI0019665EEA|nr:DNA primase [Desulfobulbus alkaliphilus]MBM9536858.1 DNA primase [Desulfobulbus alkaliphilus]
MATERDQIKNEVKEAADIVEVVGEYVALKKTGVRFSGLCPFHAEKTPSFTVNPQGQFFHCFGCGESGDVFSFLMKYHHFDFPEALQAMAKKYGIALPEKELSEAEKARLRQRDALYAANEAASTVYRQGLLHMKWGQIARKYLEERGIPAEFTERYRLGYAPEPEQAGWSYLIDQLGSKGLSPQVLETAGLAVRNDRGGYYDRFRGRIMFPLLDMTGRLAAFGGRIVGQGKPKYMNSPESPIFDKSRLLYGLFQHREAIRRQRRALVVEGNFDLLLLAVHGIDHVVAPLGTALSRSHIHTLRGYGEEVVLLFDADAAGLKAAMRSVPFFLQEKIEGRVALLPPGHDPDSYVREHGPEAIVRLVEQARPLAEFAFDTLVRTHGLTLSGKSRIIGELSPLLAAAADPGQRALMIAHFSEKMGISPGYFTSGQPLATSATANKATSAGSCLQQMSRQERQLIDFLLNYPEYLTELKAAGLDEIVREPLVRRIIALLDQRDDNDDSSYPERLLSAATHADERSYIVELLTRGTGTELDPGIDNPGRHACDEILVWLESIRCKRVGADLQQRIQEAERLGNIEMLMQLMQEKKEIGKKRKGS